MLLPEKVLVHLSLPFIFALLSAIPAPGRKPEYGLSYGVTVALQILVLSVKVRILVAQQAKQMLRFFYAANGPAYLMNRHWNFNEAYRSE